jgi:transglutaminase superfamily protein
VNRISRARRRWGELPATRRTLLVQALTLVVAARVGLKVLPFSLVRRCLTQLAKPRTVVVSTQAELQDVIWAVEVIGRHLPAYGTCLTQALAAHVLIGRSGLKSDLRIGVTRNQRGNFEAHAWLEKDGTVIIGGVGHTEFTPMPVLNGLDPPIPRRQ